MVLFDKYGTCPDIQLIMRKITDKINELDSEYKKNFDSKLENLGRRNNMSNLYESINKGFNRRYLKEDQSDIEDEQRLSRDIASKQFEDSKQLGDTI